MILLSAHQVEKSFATQTLFKNVSFGIQDKDRIGFVGPNGAGKSTLLKILAGETDADRGTISKKKGLRIGFLQQTPVFSPGDTIISAILQNSSNNEDVAPLAHELIARLELTTFGENFAVSSLSGGW